ncbi:FKBP-type peptidyl-prolyl cis-trans isomerase [Teredinibacter turnerae]|uniref:FKBP-type peptidyl-prolyl cis-trans isomerase n=1 Tax=Teredinibacter turnerae TaxID=2426 RepID=UPI00039B8972|nr:FKBP-type peptidyl-prolyl cis-trans isomerase [Teredinibacter turnerae]
MRKSILAMAVLGIALAGCKNEAQQAPAQLSSDEQREAYAVGMYIGEKVKDVVDENRGVDPNFDVDLYLRGITDTVKGDMQMSQEDAKAVFLALQKEVREYKRAEQQRQREENLAKAHAFMEENKSKEGIQVTESGLQYRVLKEGDGESPDKLDRVSVFYKGTLTDGAVFDQTEPDKPRQFQVNRLVKGWTEALQLMKKGEKIELFVPPELGYGNQDRSRIPPNSVLVFELELVDIAKREAPKKS